jgi:creatinine amidohydrolase/Fe(II)-dependent formamide hydrolase-like protein
MLTCLPDEAGREAMMPHLMPGATTDDKRTRGARVAILPIGSFEQHGPYLPLITDTAVACSISQPIARRLPSAVFAARYDLLLT